MQAEHQGWPDPWAWTLLDGADFVALACDPAGVIRQANAAAQRLLGYAPEELIGRTPANITEPSFLTQRATQLSRELGRRIEPGINALFARVTNGRADEFDWTGLHQNGKPLPCRLTISAVNGRHGQPHGFAVAIHDRSKQVVIEPTLQESLERFGGAFEDSPVGMALVAPDGYWLRANPAFCRMLGYTEEELRGLTFVDVSHPDDVGISITRDCELLSGLRGSYQLEKRYIRKDGEVVRALVNASLVRGPNQRPLHFVAQVLDVTAQRQAEEALRESEERFRDLFENASDLIQCVDDVGKFIYVNRAWREKLGYEEHEVHGLSLHEVLDPDHVESSLKLLRRLVTGEECGTVEMRFRSRDGRTVVAEGSVSCSFRDGRPAFVRGIFRDVTERRAFDELLDNYRNELEDANRRLAEVNTRLEELATTDPLTGLKNRLVLQQKLEEEHQRALRYATPVALILLDVDRFKAFNDTFGHPAGDAVLRQVAQILMLNARNTDVVARFGGEEFAVLLPSTDIDGAVALAERFREAIEAGPWDKRRVTASFGVASFDEEMDEAMGLVSAADAMLYRAKQRGRNRVECRTGERLDETVVLVTRLAGPPRKG